MANLTEGNPGYTQRVAGSVHCGHCKGVHENVEAVRDCSGRLARQRALEQIRRHGLAGAGLAKGGKKDKVALAALLHATQTTAERHLGEGLSRLSVRFVAQCPLYGYIVDFYAPSHGIAIEVDGSVHNERSTADQLRDEALRVHGVRVLRFTNSEVIGARPKVMRQVSGTLRAVPGETRRKARAATRREVLRVRFDREWDQWRYGTGARAGVVVKPSAEQTRAARKPAPGRAPMAKYRCMECDREFMTSTATVPVCRRDSRHRIHRLCKACGKVCNERSSFCERCRDDDIHALALTAAGPGAKTPSGFLRQATRGRQWKGH
jgi:very-short-patch-repair endonuclease